MNNQEARFILGAYRPDGRDAGDPTFADALAQAGRDPELRTWLERQRKFDTACTEKLGEVPPPAGLREAILAGARVSQPRRRWWANPVWLSTAATIALIAAVSITIGPSAGSPPVSDLATFALTDITDAHEEHVGFPPTLADLQARLGAAEAPLPTVLSEIDLNELRGRNCRRLLIAGREIFEICFLYDGTWYHLYAGRREDFGPGAVDPRSMITAQGEYAATAWADSKHAYALVTDDEEALRRLI